MRRLDTSRFLPAFALALLLGGCGSDSKPAAKTDADSAPASAAKRDTDGAAEGKPGTIDSYLSKKEFVVKGDEPFRGFVGNRVAKSALWESYFAKQRAAKAAPPFVQFDVGNERSSSDQRGIVSTSIEVKLIVTDMLTQKPLWTDKAVEDMAHHTLPAKFQYDELMKRMPASAKLDTLVERAAFLALCSAGKSAASEIAAELEKHPEYLTGPIIESILGMKLDLEVAQLIFTRGVRLPDLNTQLRSFDAILRLAPEIRMPILATLTDHPNVDLRLKVVDIMTKAGPASAPTLVKALEDVQVHVLAKAKYALNRWAEEGKPEVKAQVPRLLELAKGAPLQTRLAAMHVLSFADREAGMPVFADGLMDENGTIRDVVVRYLQPLGPKLKAVLPQLEAGLTGPARLPRLDVLALLKSVGPDARPTVALALKDTVPKVRLTAARILAEWGPDGIAELKALEDDKDEQVIEFVKATLNAGKERPRARGVTPAAAEKPTTPAAAEQPAAPAAAEQPKAAEKPATAESKKKQVIKVFTMKDGKKVVAQRYVDFGDAYSIKTTAGKMITVPKSDVEKIDEVTEEQ